ncbi:uncharacterized protein LOC116341669 [Contarinia nasturtii]|uniref:uncharacterized protein LOC116341669 n=1 Tax=Contarinia nasturtii TaxID=265458 RepID=UPI0012D46682|nr:uncharacterized protein LOC116341669 [Contarinia nasturtii]
MSSPPNKRMKLQSVKRSHSDDSNKENQDPEHIPKRKVAKRRSVLNFIDLNTYVLLNVLDYLDYEDLCNLATTSHQMRSVARKSFSLRANNGINFPLRQPHSNGTTLIRVLETFGDLITSISISSSTANQ